MRYWLERRPSQQGLGEIKERFYSTLRDAVKTVLITNKFIKAGDFNAGVGTEVENWPGVIGPNGIGKCNSNGKMLLAFCSEFQLVITKTVFKHNPHHLNTWMHPRFKHWQILDYVITRQRDQNDILDTRAMRGADCATDDVMLPSKIAFALQ